MELSKLKLTHRGKCLTGVVQILPSDFKYGDEGLLYLILDNQILIEQTIKIQHNIHFRFDLCIPLVPINNEISFNQYYVVIDTGHSVQKLEINNKEVWENIYEFLVQPCIFYLPVFNRKKDRLIDNRFNTSTIDKTNRFKVSVSQSKQESIDLQFCIGFNFMKEIIPATIELQVICCENKTAYEDYINKTTFEVGFVKSTTTFTFKNFSKVDQVIIPIVEGFSSIYSFPFIHYHHWVLRLKCFYDENKAVEHLLKLYVLPQIKL